MAFESGTCWQCGQTLHHTDYLGDSRCGNCGAATHACRNCRHYRLGQHNDCMENQADRVVDKNRANRCDWFQPGQPQAGQQDATTKSADTLRAAAEDLFK